MIVIADIRMPEAAKAQLAELAKPLWLEPQHTVYASIAAHPDIFFCQTKTGLIAAPDIPESWQKWLIKEDVSFRLGQKHLAANYPQTAVYNAVATNQLLIHKLSITDPHILGQYPPEERMQVSQGYTRCNLLALNENHFITSDRGIAKALQNKQKMVFYIDPKQLVLPGQQHGFFGGCCGIMQQKLVICGDFRKLKESSELEAFVNKSGYQIVTLGKGPLVDIGSLLFIEPSSDSFFPVESFPS